jgi:hypothetical protein
LVVQVPVCLSGRLANFREGLLHSLQQITEAFLEAGGPYRRNI